MFVQIRPAGNCLPQATGLHGRSLCHAWSLCADIMGEIDLIIDVRGGGDPDLMDFLKQLEGRTKTARCLAEKPVVLIEPFKFKGTKAWPR